MIQCEDCEYYSRNQDGSPHLACDPFSTIKESECIAKWQLLELTVMARSHQATLDMHRRMAPLQEKLFRHVEREVNDADEADRWKQDESDDDDGGEHPFGT
jgi:hypothetical protein